MHYKFNLLCFIPLVEFAGSTFLIEEISKLHYNDAQTYLMQALYQYDPTVFYNDLKEIMLYWHKNKNIEFEEATCMLSEFAQIIQKYLKHQFNILEDPDLKCIFYEFNQLDGTYSRNPIWKYLHDYNQSRNES